MNRGLSLFFNRVPRWFRFAEVKNGRGNGLTIQPLLERLEDRIVLSTTVGLASPSDSEPSAREQYLLELVNRMRLNPADELGLLLNAHDPNVDNALAYFHVN